MNKIAKVSLITLTTVVLGAASLAALADRGEYGERCENYRGGHHAMFKHRWGEQHERNLNLSADDAKTLVSAHLIMQGNERLKVGQVAQKDEQTYVVDIVTVDDSLVRQVEVDKDNGFKRRWHREGKYDDDHGREGRD
jgi:hypothetical protein